MTTSDFEPQEPAGRSPWPWRIAAVAFGLMLGITADRLFLLPARPSFGPPQIPGAEMSAGLRESFVRQLGDELQLSDSQRAAVATLIEQQYPKVRAAGDSARAVFDRATIEPRTEMMKILTPAQRARFSKLTGMPVDTLGVQR